MYCWAAWTVLFSCSARFRRANAEPLCGKVTDDRMFSSWGSEFGGRGGISAHGVDWRSWV